jgi:hypothetical protein
MRRILVVLVLAALGAASEAAAQPRVEKNVIYGMYSGLALLMDIHYPEKSNGHGVMFVSGSAWTARLTYGTVALKEEQIPQWSPALLRAGYTVFPSIIAQHLASNTRRRLMTSNVRFDLSAIKRRNSGSIRTSLAVWVDHQAVT